MSPQARPKGRALSSSSIDAESSFDRASSRRVGYAFILTASRGRLARPLEELGGFDAHARRAEVHMVIVDSHLSRRADAV